MNPSLDRLHAHFACAFYADGMSRQGAEMLADMSLFGLVSLALLPVLALLLVSLALAGVVV